MPEHTIHTEALAASALPFDILLQVIVTLLAPIFLSVAGGDTGLARQAAEQAVIAHRPRDQADLIAISQIVASGLASLASISRSAEDGLPLPMVLRLRGNSVALSRTAEQARRTLQKTRSAMASSPKAPSLPAVPSLPDVPSSPTRAKPDVRPDAMGAEARQPAVDAAVAGRAEVEAAIPSPAAFPAEEQRLLAAGDGVMAGMAGKHAGGQRFFPTAARKPTTVRTATLSSVANALLTGEAQAPLQPDLAALLRSPLPLSHESARPQPRV